MSGLNRREWLAAAGGGAALLAATQTRAESTPAPLRLSLNESAFRPSPRVAAAIEAAIPGLERYVDQSEVDILARQIAAKEQVDPTQIVIGEVLDALGLFLARRRPGGGGIVHSVPGYTALVDAAAPLGGVGVPIPLDARHENDLPALAGAIDERTLAVSIINPHNPSGTVSDARAFDAFVHTASARTLVVVDEAYLEYDDLPGRSAIRHLRSGANVLVFRTLAKIYGLAGLSIGYAVTRPALAEEIRRAGIGAPHSFSRLALAGAAAALADQAHVARVADANRIQRERLTAAIAARGYRLTDSRANFVFFDAGTAAVAVRHAFADADIAIGRAFPPLDNWVRVTVGAAEQTDRLMRVVAALPGPPAR